MSDDLRWIGTALGEVRDADVLAVRLEAQARDELADDDREGLDQLKTQLASEREEGYQRLLVVLDSDRYLDAVDALAAGPPPVRADAAGMADSPAQAALGPVVRRSWKKLRRTVDTLDKPPTDAQLHQVRIKAKQLRYGSEAAAVVLGKPAAKLAEAATKLQDLLGEHHDAVAAEAWLRHQGASMDASPGIFAAGELVMVQRREQARLREHWPSVWKSVRAKRLRRWLR